MMGDSYAKLGEFINDGNTDGEMTSNINKALFLGFLKHTGILSLYRVFARGQPTYEILGKKRSIIDVGLVNNIRSVKAFRVLPQILGVNAQLATKS